MPLRSAGLARLWWLLALAAGAAHAADFPPPGLYRVVQVAVEQSGSECRVGAPLEPAYLLKMGPFDDPEFDEARGLLVDDGGVVMPIIADPPSGFALVDASEPKATLKRGLGKATPGAAPLTLEVEFTRYDLPCTVRGTLRFAPSSAAADARRVERLAEAWLAMRSRDAKRTAGDPRSAITDARAAETLFSDELGAAHRLTSMATGMLGSLYKDLSEPVEARRLEQAALAGLTATLGKDHVSALQQANNLAIVEWDLGDLDGAEARLRAVADGYATVLDPDDGSRLGTLTNLATLVAQRGRYREAEAILRDVVLRRERVFGPTHPATIVTINNLASVYSASGWLDEAGAQMLEAYERYRATLGPRHPATLRTRSNAATVSARRGELAVAIDEYRAVLAARREVLGPRHAESLITQGSLAAALAQAGEIGEALALQRDAVAVSAAELGPTNVQTLQAEATLGGIESRAGEHAAALERLQRVLSVASAQLGADDPGTIQIAEQYGNALHAAGRPAAARAALESVVAAVEAWRDRAGFSASRRAVLFARWVRAYKLLAFVAAAQGDAQAAFEQAERSKARVLVESLALRRGETAAILPPEALRRLAELDARVTMLETQQSRTPDAARRTALGQELAAAVEQAAAERAALRTRHPRYAALSQPRLVSAREGSAELESGALFVSYLVHDERVLAFTLARPGRLRAVDLGKVAGLEATIRAYRALLSNPFDPPPVWKLADGSFSAATKAPPGAVRARNADEIGARLYSMLVKPLPELARATRWIVAPDGPLALVPFEALPEKGRPLAATRAIRYTPSLTVHTLTAQRAREYRRADVRGPLYAMGAALYGAAPAAAATSSPQALDAAQVGRALAGERGGTARAYDRIGRSWVDLPASLQEIETVAAGFKPLGNVVVRARELATERQLRADDRSGLLARQRYVLLSAHGYLSTETPSLSAVVLGRPDTAESDDDDGYVTAAEWAGYTLRSDLIVVSACETGVGRVIEGEGVAGLPYALFVAGNRNVLLTLWPVADESAAAFVVRFFALVRAGRSQVDALATVKREFAASGRFRSPLHWAPFVLWGS